MDFLNLFSILLKSLVEIGGSNKSRLCAKSLANFLGLASLLGLLGEENSLDVGEDTTLGDGDSGEKLVQFLIIADGELQVTGDDTGLLVVASGVTGQFEDLSGQVLHYRSQVNGGTSSNTFSVVTFSEQTVDSTYRELKTGTAGSGLCLPLNFASFTSSGHGGDREFLVRYEVRADDNC